MIAYSEIADLVAAGKSPAEIHDLRQADMATRHDVPIDRARQLLITEWGLISRFDGHEVGPIADMYRALPTDHPARDSVRQLISHLLDNSSAQHITLTDSAYAAAFFELIDHPALALTQDQLAQLASIHGGRKTQGETVQDVERCILGQKLSDAINAANSAFARGETWEQIVAAFSGVA